VTRKYTPHIYVFLKSTRWHVYFILMWLKFMW